MRSAARLITVSLAAAALAGCTGAERPSPVAALATEGPAADYPVVIGEPFMVDGVRYTPVDTLNYDAVGYAGAADAVGARISATHRTLPLPSYAEVTALDSGRTILVRVEQRGPMTNSRLVDLSPGAFAQLGLNPAAPSPVRVRRVNPPEVERARLRAGERAPDRLATPEGLLAALRRKLGDVPAAPRVAPAPEAAAAAVPGVPLERLAVAPSVFAADAGPAATEAPVAAPAEAEAPELQPLNQPDPQVAPGLQAAPEVQKLPEGQPAAERVTQAEAAVAQDPAATGWQIQAATFSSRERAEVAAKALGGSVAPAGRFWRVRLGPFEQADAAKEALAKVHAAGYADARIVRAR